MAVLRHHAHPCGEAGEDTTPGGENASIELDRAVVER